MIAKLGKKNVLESVTLVSHDDYEYTSALIGGVTVIVLIGDDGGAFASSSEIVEDSVVLRFANIGERAFNDFTVSVGAEKRHLLAYVDAVGEPGRRAYRLTLTMAEG